MVKHWLYQLQLVPLVALLYNLAKSKGIPLTHTLTLNGSGIISFIFCCQHSCYVVGIVGSEPKAKWLIDELKCDAVVNYKAPEGLKAQLDRALGARKVDVYYDNTGGEISDNIITRINR
jgi:NADPH:quinone reductase-like Zn-dependent oxidoreductase